MGYVEELRELVGQRPLLFVGAVVVITDETGKVLLQQRTYPKGVWGLPGGLMELGESAEETAKREVYEETGLLAEDLQLINVYSGQDHFAIAENGDEFYTVTVAYYTHRYAGDWKIDETESIQVDFADPNDLPEDMVGSHRKILTDFLSM